MYICMYACMYVRRVHVWCVSIYTLHVHTYTHIWHTNEGELFKFAGDISLEASAATQTCVCIYIHCMYIHTHTHMYTHQGELFKFAGDFSLEASACNSDTEICTIGKNSSNYMAEEHVLQGVNRFVCMYVLYVYMYVYVCVCVVCMYALLKQVIKLYG
jgi:hypothetical protein